MITFNNIVERFEIFAENHFFIKTFSFGSPDDVDLSKFTSFPLMHLVYTGATYDAGTKTYNLEVYILDAPADKDGKVIRQKEVVSDAEQCAEDIIADIKNGGNIFLFAQDYEVVNATTTPLEEETKNVLSGVLLDLSVAISYEWDACNAPIDGVTPEGGDEISYARRGILRMVTQNGATDVLSVRTIKVTNGTLTDEGDGVVSLDTAGAESLDELTDVYLVTLENNQILRYQAFSLPGSPAGWKNQDLDLSALSDTKGTPVEGHLLKYTGGFWQPSTIDLNTLDGVTVTTPQTGNVLQYSSTFGWYNTNLPTPSPPPSTTDALPEGTVNLYYTEARVSANTDVAANTAKVGITAQQAADILNNNAKVSLIAGGTTGQALVKTSGTDYDVEWADISIDVQYHNRYQSESETLRAGATATTELYYSAQADGDGLAESASSDTPAAGYDIRRKLYYSEAGFADPDTGTWTQFTAIADNTTFNNAKAALLAYLKERTGGTVPISLKMTWEEVSQTAYLLDQSYGSGAEAAYSTRQLRNAATDCMVIRRASDSTTTTIGFDGSGNIDESAITTFCTGTTCTVVTWKDQSGNGNDATAAAPTNEPTIYTGGALVKENGKVAVQFDGSDDGFPLTLSGLNVNNLSVVTVCKSDVTSGDKMQFTLNTGSNGRYWHYMAGGNDTMWYGGTVSISHGRMDTNQRLRTFIAGSTSGAARSFLNGTEGPTTRPLVSATLTANEQFLGNYHTGSFYWDGNMQEFIVWGADQFNNRTSIESNIADYFTQNTPLLDTYSGAAAAYSLRLLDSSYVGSAVEVYNGSSYADIGFNVFGELDTVALAAHCGSNDGFVSKWYDQSGNSNTATQTTTAYMPKIYDGTTGVVTENGKPAMQFDGSNDQFNMNAVSTTSAFTLARSTSFNFANRFLGGTIAIDYSGQDATFGLISASDGTNVIRIPSSSNDNTRYLLSVLGIGASGAIYRNGNVGVTGTLNTMSFNEIGDRSVTANINFAGTAQEIILYNSDQSSNRTNIEDNINTFYSIY